MANYYFRSFLGLSILIFSSLASCQSSTPVASQPSIIGTWEGYYGHTLKITFGDDGRFEANSIGGGIVLITTLGHYSVNTSTTPIQLDQTLPGGANVLTILEFIDQDTILMELNPPNAPRATSFSDSSVKLHRIKP